jgi:putative Mg2+ transporter-C (MgtC) family protein
MRDEAHSGAGLPVLAVCVTPAHFLVLYGYRPIERRVLSARAELQVRYAPGKGAVEKIVQMCTGRGFQIQELAVEQNDPESTDEARTIHLRLQGRGSIEPLVLSIGDIKGVASARTLASDPVKEWGRDGFDRLPWSRSVRIARTKLPD